MKRAFGLLASLIVAIPSTWAVDDETKASPDFQKLLEEGKSIYALHCTACHQPDGSGMMAAANTRLAPPLTGSDWLNDDDRIIRIVLHGMTGEITVGEVTMVGAMLPYGNMLPLDDRKVAVILSYIRNNWGNSGPLISSKRVAQIREATKDRSTPYTVAEILAAHPLKEEGE